jgi:hypothetical protein
MSQCPLSFEEIEKLIDLLEAAEAIEREEANAVQERKAESLPARERAEAGEEMGQGDGRESRSLEEAPGLYEEACEEIGDCLGSK